MGAAKEMSQEMRVARLPNAVWLLVAVLLACDDEAVGGPGESCAARSDCEQGLRCVAQVCRAEADLTEDAGTPPTSGREGASCGARPDCAPGLSCVANVCQPTASGGTGGNRYSGRGESCAAANDCVEGLACVGGNCRDVSVELARTPKECVRVECAAAADCCESFVPNESCDIYEANCETDPIFCNTFRNLCECNQDCVDEVCVASAPGCSSDAECMSQQTPFCVEERCVQCDQDSSCPGAGSRCVDGACLAPCEVDENCPLLHACEDGECVEVGCRSDRECVFLDDDPLAVCRDGECDVPCTQDTDCVEDGRRFQVCVEGSCTFVGCESDAECRALLMLENSPDDTRAICR